MRFFMTVPALAIVLCLSAHSRADGLIHRLPEDGTWARFEIEGQGFESDGTVSTTVKGTQTLRSVGTKRVDNQPCRWIELETEVTFERVGRGKGKSKEFLKLLIPESQLVKEKDPRDHVLKAYRGTSAETMQELDLKGKSEIQSLDEIFHAPLKMTTKLPPMTIRVKEKNWECEGAQGEEKMENVTFTTETRTHKQAPFGVVTYKYTKERQSQEGRTMTWNLVDFGKDAKSAAPKAE